jgi:hypothetical protein
MDEDGQRDAGQDEPCVAVACRHREQLVERDEEHGAGGEGEEAGIERGRDAHRREPDDLAGGSARAERTAAR